MLVANIRVFLAETKEDTSADHGTLLSYSNSLGVAALAALLSSRGRLIASPVQRDEDSDCEPSRPRTGGVRDRRVPLAGGPSRFRVKRRADRREKYTRRPNAVQQWSLCVVLFAAVDISIVRFVGDALSFRGWFVQLYAGLLSLSIASWIFAVFLPLLANAKEGGSSKKSSAAASLPIPDPAFLHDCGDCRAHVDRKWGLEWRAGGLI